MKLPWAWPKSSTRGEQRVRQAGAVDGHQRRAPLLAALVDEVGDDLADAAAPVINNTFYLSARRIRFLA